MKESAYEFFHLAVAAIIFVFAAFLIISEYRAINDAVTVLSKNEKDAGVTEDLKAERDIIVSDNDLVLFLYTERNVTVAIRTGDVVTSVLPSDKGETAEAYVYPGDYVKTYEYDENGVITRVVFTLKD